MREGKYLIKTTTTAEVQEVTAALRGTHEGSPPHNNKTAPHPPTPRWTERYQLNADADVSQLRAKGHARVRNGLPV